MSDDDNAPKKSHRTNWDITRAQFLRNRGAVIGLWILIGLFLLAVVAPVLSTSSPFYLNTPDGGVEFPWFVDLFDQNRFPSGVDLFFNLLLLFLPLTALVAGFALKRGSRRLAGRLALGLGAVFLYCFTTMVVPGSWLESTTGKVVFFGHEILRHQKPKRDYLETRSNERMEILASERLEQFQARLKQAQDKLAAAEAEFQRADLSEQAKRNAQAERSAAQTRVTQTQRKVDEWQTLLDGAQTALADPEQQVSAFLPPIGYHHDDNDEQRIVEAPTFSGWGNGHYLGTDANGRDVVARILYGTRVSLTIGVLAVLIYCTIGIILGSLMGYFGGWVDFLLMRWVEIMICFPVFAFVLIVVAVFETKNIFLIMVAIGIVSWTSVARLIRGQFLVERGQEYVLAARALGIPAWRVVFQHVLPNAVHPMFVTATFGVASAILLESSLAFLGLGDPNVPSWGQLLLEGRQTGKLWLILAPGTAIFLTVTVLNLVGEGLRDALDPKLRR